MPDFEDALDTQYEAMSVDAAITDERLRRALEEIEVLRDRVAWLERNERSLAKLAFSK